MEEFIGLEVGLISKAENRYQGTLIEFDLQRPTITLSNVQSFGTEDRPCHNHSEPKDDIIDQLVFIGEYLKELYVIDNNEDREDPAIIRSQLDPLTDEQKQLENGEQILHALSRQRVPKDDQEPWRTQEEPSEGHHLAVGDEDLDRDDQQPSEGHHLAVGDEDLDQDLAWGDQQEQPKVWKQHPLEPSQQQPIECNGTEQKPVVDVSVDEHENTVQEGDQTLLSYVYRAPRREEVFFENQQRYAREEYLSRNREERKSNRGYKKSSWFNKGSRSHSSEADAESSWRSSKSDSWEGACGYSPPDSKDTNFSPKDKDFGAGGSVKKQM